MKFNFSYPKDVIEIALEAERKGIARKLRKVVEGIGRSHVLMPMRDATRKAFPTSRKMPTTWRGQVYPEAPRNTLEPAYVVYSEAAGLIQTHIDGATIRPTGGKRFLWIPTANVPLRPGGKRWGPKEIEERFKGFRLKPTKRGGYLATVEAQARKGFAQDPNDWLGKRHINRRAKSFRWLRATKKARTENRVQSVPMFILVRQVTLRKRIDPDAIMAAAAGPFAAAVSRALGGGQAALP